MGAVPQAGSAPVAPRGSREGPAMIARSNYTASGRMGLNLPSKIPVWAGYSEV